MKLSKAFAISVEYLGKNDPIRIDSKGLICLTDMIKFFPRKRLDNWIRLDSTKEFIQTVEEFLNTSDVSDLKPLYRRRGKYDGGTYAHELVAMEFATWLSPEFKLKVFLEYMNGSQKKENWNVSRILSAYNYKLLSLAIKDAHDVPKPYHFSNEALMINEIVFNIRDKSVRDKATEEQLNLIAQIESENATMIKLGMEYKDRKAKLKDLYPVPLEVAVVDF